MSEHRTIGLIGFGFIGQNIPPLLAKHAPDIRIGWIFDAAPERQSAIPAGLGLTALDQNTPAVDLVIEAAHPDVVRSYGADFLQKQDFLPLSITALADAALYDRLVATAAQNGTTLWLPHGASIGVDGVFALRDQLTEVTITTVKPVANLDHSVQQAQAGQGETGKGENRRIVYDGPTREACRLFPRSVNSHAVIALAGIGFDRTRSVMIEDAQATHTNTEIRAIGPDIDISITRSNPMQGVSSQMMPHMVTASILVALKATPAIFC